MKHYIILYYVRITYIFHNNPTLTKIINHPPTLTFIHLRQGPSTRPPIITFNMTDSPNVLTLNVIIAYSYSHTLMVRITHHPFFNYGNYGQPAYPYTGWRWPTVTAITTHPHSYSLKVIIINPHINTLTVRITHPYIVEMKANQPTNTSTVMITHPHRCTLTRYIMSEPHTHTLVVIVMYKIKLAPV